MPGLAAVFIKEFNYKTKSNEKNISTNRFLNLRQ